MVLTLHSTLSRATMKRNTTRYPCSYCERTFTQQGNLKTHEKIHTGDKPFSCSQCDYKCSRSNHLKIHERIHTGDKPFSCSKCDYKCSQKSSLKIHERIHTGDNHSAAPSVATNAHKKVV